MENNWCSGKQDRTHCPFVTLNSRVWMQLEGGPLGKKKKKLLSPS